MSGFLSSVDNNFNNIKSESSRTKNKKGFYFCIVKFAICSRYQFCKSLHEQEKTIEEKMIWFFSLLSVLLSSVDSNFVLN